jgi:hypothetical protein
MMPVSHIYGGANLLREGHPSRNRELKTAYSNPEMSLKDKGFLGWG